MSLQVKLILGFGLITIPLICFLLYTNDYSSKVVRNQVTNFNSGLLTLYGDQIDQTLNTDSKYLYKLSNQEPLIRSLVYNMDKEDAYTLTQVAISGMLYSGMFYTEHIYFDFVYNPFNRDMIFAQPVQESYEEYIQIKTHLEGLFTADNRAELQASELRWTTCRIGNENFLLRIAETDTNTYVGALVRSEDLMAELNSVSKVRNINAFFLDGKGNFLTADPVDAAEEVQAAVLDRSGDSATVHGKQAYLVVYHWMNASDLALAVIISEKSMLQQVPLFQRISYVIPFVAGGLLVLFLIYLQRLVIQPMHRLTKGMRQIGKGNMDARLPIERSFEFGMIGETFNHMASEIRDLKIHVYEEEIRLRKAELKQLQLQMNPHFLFNSLNIIYNLAEIGKVQLIKQMAHHMVGFLRFFARLNENLTSVREELDNVNHYMQIQMLRFPKHLDYNCTIDPAVEEGLIPPLTVQPFVENAVKHGFTTGKNLFRVQVEAKAIVKLGEEWCELRIEDNGKGFPQALVERLHEMLEDRSFTNEHIGIWNIYHRLNMLYDGRTELVLSNAHPRGACVIIRIPLRKREQEGAIGHVQPVDRG